MSSVLLLPTLSNLNLVERFLVKPSGIKFHEDIFHVSRVASTGEREKDTHYKKASVAVPSAERIILTAA